MAARQVVLTNETDWQGWRLATRKLVLAGVEPRDVEWSVGGTQHGLPDATGSFHLPRALVLLASVAIQAREPDRFGLLYSLIWRAHSGEKLLDDSTDADLLLARRMALAVRADAHRMRTNMRFLPVIEDGEIEPAVSPERDAREARRRFLGWFEPAHFVLPANAQLIARRFARMIFSIITPDGSAHWDGVNLRFGSGLRHAQDDETLAAWWEAHRKRLLHDSMEATSVPEAEGLDEAPRPPDRPALGPVVLRVDPDPALITAAKEASACRRCPLHEPATQTVFGEGPAGAGAMFLGEQPGDQEDTIGRPFVGPAGQIMDRALEEAGIDRRTIYVTNAVKHFKFTPRGQRRIHQTPDTPEIEACAFWLDVERVRVRPSLLVLLGGTAARAVLGRPVTISRERGRPIKMPDGQTVFVTVHPSYLLRVPDEAAKAREYVAFVRDLTTIRELMKGG